MSKRLMILTGSIFLFIFEELTSLLQILFGKKKPDKCVILYYHGISTKERKRFARQMDELLKLCRPVSLDPFCVPRDGCRFAAVTFDDGLISTVENALPELALRQIPSALFIPAGCLGRHSKLRHNLSANHDRVVTAAELKQIAGRMVTIGSHCLSHRDLMELDEIEAKDEITRSKQELEEILGRPVQFLSFPFGSFGPQHVTYAREAGYTKVFSISPVLAPMNSGDFIIGRVRVDPSDWRVEFRLKLLGYYRWLPRAFSLKSRLKRVAFHHFTV